MEKNLLRRIKFQEWRLWKYEFRYIRNCLDHAGLYKGDPRLLMLVAAMEGCSQAQIASSLSIKPASLTVMIKRMESAGLIRREQDEKDMRTLRVYITQKGREVAGKTGEVMQSSFHKIYQGLTDEEILQYQSVIEKKLINLRELTEDLPKDAF